MISLAMYGGQIFAHNGNFQPSGPMVCVQNLIYPDNLTATMHNSENCSSREFLGLGAAIQVVATKNKNSMI